MDNPLDAVIKGGRLAQPWDKPLSPDDLLSNPIAAMMAKPTDRASLAVDTALRQGKPWEEVEGEVRGLGVDPSHFRQGYKLESARKQIEGQGFSSLRGLAIQSLPFGDFGDVRGTGAYAEAQKRFQEGKASDEDIDTIAKYEEEQAGLSRVNQTLGGKVLGGLAGVPKLVGEFYLGGKVLKGLGAAGRGLGILKAAPHPPMLAAMNPGLAGQIRSHAGRMALLLPTQSGMYMEQAKQNNIAAGRDPNDIRGFRTALGHGYASLLVLGSLQNRLPSWVPQPGMAGRMAAKGVVGTGEMAGVDAAFGVADEFIKDDAWKFKTGYGTVGHLVQGIRSGDGEMVKHALYDATATALTFAVFAGLHDHGPASFNRKAANDVMQNYGELLANYKQRGIPADVAGKAVASFYGRIQRAQETKPDLTRGEARGLFENLPDPIKKPLFELVDRVLPEEPPIDLGRLERRQAERAEVVTTQQPSETQSSGAATLPRADIPPETPDRSPEAPESRPEPTEAPPAPEPSPTPEVPPAATSVGSSRPAEAQAASERFYRVPSSKSMTEPNIEQARSELLGSFAGKWFSNSREGNEQYFTEGKVQYEFDPSKVEPEFLKRGEKDSTVGSRTPMYLDAALTAIRYRGRETDPDFAEFRDLIEGEGGINAERAKAGLPPIAVEVVPPKGQHAATVEPAAEPVKPESAESSGAADLPPPAAEPTPEPTPEPPPVPGMPTEAQIDFWRKAKGLKQAMKSGKPAQAYVYEQMVKAGMPEEQAKTFAAEVARRLDAEAAEKVAKRNERLRAMSKAASHKALVARTSEHDFDGIEARIADAGGLTVLEWIRQRGGIDPGRMERDFLGRGMRRRGAKTDEDVGEQLRNIPAIFTDKKGRRGTRSADELAQELNRIYGPRYDLGEVREHKFGPEDLYRLAEEHFIIEGGEGIDPKTGKTIERLQLEDMARREGYDSIEEFDKAQVAEQRKIEEQEASDWEKLKQEALESLETAGVEPGEEVPFAPPPEGRMARMRERQSVRGPQPVRPGAGRPSAKQQPLVDRNAALDDLVRELPESKREPVRDALEGLTDLNMRNAGLDYRERYVINQRLLGRTQQDIAKDRKQIGYNRRMNKDYEREYIRQIEEEALAKLGESASIAFRQKVKAGEEAARLQERQGELAVGELTGAAEGEGRKQRSLKWYEVVENDMMALNDRWAAESRDGTLTPEKEAEYKRELQRLMHRYDRGVAAEGPPPPPATAGGTRPAGGRPAPSRGRPDQQTLFSPPAGGEQPRRPQNLFDFMEDRQAERERELAGREPQLAGLLGDGQSWRDRLAFNGADLSDPAAVRASWEKMDTAERGDFARQVGSVYRDASPAERAEIRDAFIAAVPHAKTEGSPGSIEKFDAMLHDSGESAVVPGDPVRVVEPGLIISGYLNGKSGRYVVGRTVVEPKSAGKSQPNKGKGKPMIESAEGRQLAEELKAAIQTGMLGENESLRGKTPAEAQALEAELRRRAAAILDRVAQLPEAEQKAIAHEVSGRAGRSAQTARTEIERDLLAVFRALNSQLTSPPPGQGGQSSGAATLKPEPVMGDMEFLATARKEIGLPEQVEKVPPYVRDAHRGVYLGKEEAVVTGKMMVGDVPRGMHEIAHHFSAKNKLGLDPVRLPPQVRLGLKQFDYDPARPMGRTAMQEGFAEWFRRRVTGNLENLTPAQQAAAKYAEKLVSDAGLTEYVDRQAARWQRLQQASAETRASKLMSGTGDATGPQLSARQAASETTRNLIHDANEQIVDDLAVVRRLWDEAQANRKAKGMEPLPEADNPAVKMQMLMFAAKPLAGDFAQNGVKTIVDGHWQKIGLSVDEIVAGAKPEWIAPTDGGPSRAGLYAATRHIISEAEKHGMLAPRHPHLPKKTVQAGPAKGQEIWEAMDRLVVPEHELKIFREAMEEMQADREFAQWAEGFADRLTFAFNSTRRTLASKDIHRLDPEVVRYYEELRPDYVELARVLTDSGWKKSAFAGGRGERVKKLIHARSGTGEPIVDPLVSYHKRLLLTANAMTDQIKKNAVANLLQQPGMGKYGTFFESEGVAPAGQARADLLRDLGMEEAGVLDALRALGIERGEMLTTTKPWPTDGTKPTLEWTGPDGRLTSIRINDRALYDLLTGQQADSSQIARVFRSISQLGFMVPGYGRFEPLAWAGNVLKVGATGTSLAFQFRNVPRDAKTFWANTIDRTSMGELTGAYLTAYKGMIQSLMGHKPTGRLFQWFLDNRGDQMRQHAFDPALPSAKNLVSKRSIWGVMKDALGVLGAGELAPRYQEAINKLRKETGKTKAELVEMLEAADREFAETGVWRDPIPFELGLQVLNAANEVTTPFSRQGVVTRQINKLTPFFGPTIAGLSKVARNWRDNPKGAAFAMAAVLGLRAVYWAAVSDEDWWQELNAYDRYNNFVIPVGDRLYRLAGPRDLDLAGGGILTAMLDAAADKNPDFKGLFRQSLDEFIPPAPVPTPARVAWDIQGNEDFLGRPIVPRRSEGLPWLEKFTEHTGPYIAKQMTGGQSEAVLGLKVPEVHSARRSVDEYYERLKSLEGERTVALRAGRPYAKEKDYQRLHRIESQMTAINQRLRGEMKRGRRLVAGERPSEDEARKLRARQTELARRALGR